MHTPVQGHRGLLGIWESLDHRLQRQGTLQLGMKALPASHHHSPRLQGIPPSHLQRVSLWPHFGGSAGVPLHKELIRDRSQHAKEQRDHFNNLHNPLLFEALS